MDQESGLGAFATAFGSVEDNEFAGKTSEGWIDLFLLHLPIGWYSRTEGNYRRGRQWQLPPCGTTSDRQDDLSMPPTKQCISSGTDSDLLPEGKGVALAESRLDGFNTKE